MNRTVCILSLISIVITSASLPTVQCSYYYGNPVKFIETEHEPFTQSLVNVDFDRFNNVHLVWSSDENLSYRQIYHRSRLHDGSILPTDTIAMHLDCEISDCGLLSPLISFGAGSLDIGHCVYFQSAGSNPLQYTQLSYTSGTFNSVFVGDITDTDLVTDYDIASYGDYSFLVCEFQDKIRVIPGLNGEWDESALYDFLPGPDEYLLSPDVCTDEAGHLYITFDAYDMIGSTYTHRVVRSELPLSTTVFLPVRDVPGTDEWENPEIAASGSGDNLLVCLLRTSTSGATTVLSCTVEADDDDWPSGLDFGDSTMSLSIVTSYTINNQQVQIGRDNSIHAVWESNLSGVSEVYASTSLDAGGTFSTQVCLSCGTEPHLEAFNASIAVSKDAGREIAIVFDQTDMAGNIHPWLIHIPTYFHDSCDSGFEHWTTASGVSLDPLAGHHNPGCFRFATSGTRGALVADYGLQALTGTIDFWFMDSLSETSDFTMRIDGDDGLKAGVYRMIGINNASSHTTYSAFDGTSWTALTQARTAGWHHCVVQVSADGIVMYLDPETTPAGAYQSTGFVSFHRIEFQGGTDASPYYLDDVIVAAPVSRMVPAESILSVILMVFAITVGILVCSFSARHR